MRDKYEKFIAIREIATRRLVEAAATLSEENLQEAKKIISSLFNENKLLIVEFLKDLYGDNNKNIPFDLRLMNIEIFQNDLFDDWYSYAGTEETTCIEWCQDENKKPFFIRELYVANAIQYCLKKATTAEINDNDQQKYLNAAYFLMNQSVPNDSVFSAESSDLKKQGQIHALPKFAAELGLYDFSREMSLKHGIWGSVEIHQCMIDRGDVVAISASYPGDTMRLFMATVVNHAIRDEFELLKKYIPQYAQTLSLNTLYVWKKALIAAARQGHFRRCTDHYRDLPVGYYEDQKLKFALTAMVEAAQTSPEHFERTIEFLNVYFNSLKFSPFPHETLQNIEYFYKDLIRNSVSQAFYAGYYESTVIEWLATLRNIKNFYHNFDDYLQSYPGENDLIGIAPLANAIEKKDLRFEIGNLWDQRISKPNLDNKNHFIPLILCKIHYPELSTIHGQVTAVTNPKNFGAIVLLINLMSAGFRNSENKNRTLTQLPAMMMLDILSYVFNYTVSVSQEERVQLSGLNFFLEKNTPQRLRVAARASNEKNLTLKL